MAFSPDGSVIYIATHAETVFAMDSDGANTDPPLWSAAAGDGNLCDIAVSPDGLSVRQNLPFPRFDGDEMHTHMKFHHRGVMLGC